MLVWRMRVGISGGCGVCLRGLWPNFRIRVLLLLLRLVGVEEGVLVLDLDLGGDLLGKGIRGVMLGVGEVLSLCSLGLLGAFLIWDVWRTGIPLFEVFMLLCLSTGSYSFLELREISEFVISCHY